MRASEMAWYLPGNEGDDGGLEVGCTSLRALARGCRCVSIEAICSGKMMGGMGKV